MGRRQILFLVETQCLRLLKTHNCRDASIASPITICQIIRETQALRLYCQKQKPRRELLTAGFLFE